MTPLSVKLSEGLRRCPSKRTLPCLEGSTPLASPSRSCNSCTVVTSDRSYFLPLKVTCTLLKGDPAQTTAAVNYSFVKRTKYVREFKYILILTSSQGGGATARELTNDRLVVSANTFLMVLYFDIGRMSEGVVEYGFLLSSSLFLISHHKGWIQTSTRNEQAQGRKPSSEIRENGRRCHAASLRTRSGFKSRHNSFLASAAKQGKALFDDSSPTSLLRGACEGGK